jgi:hypothetical protein
LSRSIYWQGGLAAHSIASAGKDFTKSSTAFICIKNGLSKSKGRALGPARQFVRAVRQRPQRQPRAFAKHGLRQK